MRPAVWWRGLAIASGVCVWLVLAGRSSVDAMLLTLLPVATVSVVLADLACDRVLGPRGQHHVATRWSQRTMATALAVVVAGLVNRPFATALDGTSSDAASPDGGPSAAGGPSLGGLASLPGASLLGALDAALAVLPVALVVAGLVLLVAEPRAKRPGRRRLAPHARAVATVCVAVVCAGMGAAAAAPAASARPTGAGAAAAAAPPVTGTNVCPASSRVITYDIAAMALDIPLNGWGDHLPNGMLYALKGADARVGTAQLRANPQLSQPLVVRAAVGDCIKVVLRNDLPTTFPPAADPTVARGPIEIGTPHPDVEPTPPARVGIHPDGLVQFDPITSDGARVGRNPDTTVGRGEERTYTWYADHEGQAPIVDIANIDSTAPDGNAVQHGLFGAVVVHPAGSSWHDQVTGKDMIDEQTGRAVETDVAADVHVPAGQSFRSFVAVVMDEIEGVKDSTQNNPTSPESGLADSTFGINYRSEPLRNRLRAILEHRGTKTVQNRKGVATAITLPNGTTYQPSDHFCDGWVPDLGRVVDDPGAKCLGEESHLQSWVFGDEGKLVHRNAAGDLVTDTDVMIAKAYRGDPIHFHLVHPGAKETHPWHQHTQRWFADPRNPKSPQKDVQSIGPGEAYEFDIEGGAGGLQGAIGDSIFHCHLYPHFAQGFWGNERIFDRLRDGTQRYPDGTQLQALQQLPDRVGATPAADALHPGYPLFLKGDVGQRAYRIPYAVVKDPFAAIRRPGDTLRKPTKLESDNLPALSPDAPGSGAINPCPPSAPVRTYRPHATDLPITYNKAGWTDRQGRIFIEESHQKDVLARREAPVPYTIRARQGECVQLMLTNDLNLDEDPTVPLDHVNRLDGAYSSEAATSEVSAHVHLVRFDELGSDGTSVGWNYVQAAMPGQTYGYRWYVDQALRTVFFHDHQYANLHQQKGLFSAVNIEPPDATWTDPTTGRPTDGTGPMADIHSALGPGFREFTLFYSDRIPLWKQGGYGSAVSPPQQVDDYGADQGGYAINLRNEPFSTRIGPGATGKAADPAYVFSSAVHGDPSTPLLRAYSGDPVVIRQVTGAHEEVHSFTLHGHRWLNEPDNPQSTMTDIQGAALAEYFNFELVSGSSAPRRAGRSTKEKREAARVDRDNGGVSVVVGGAGRPGDYLYGSTALDDQWLGMWGIFRTTDKLQPDLAPLPDRTTPTIGKAWPAIVPGAGLKKAPPAAACPKGYRVRTFDVVAMAKPIVYDPVTGDNDPDGLLYALASDEAAIRSGTRAPTPLVLRVQSGECISVRLSNHLPAAGPPQHGDDVGPPAAEPFPRGKRVSLHAGLVDTPVIQGDGTAVGYNYDSTVGPGESTTMTWIVPTDVGTASIPLMDYGDRVGNRHHGLFGALLVEPSGATWVDPRTGGPASGVEAEVRWTEGKASYAAREFVAMWQDGLTLRDRSGAVVSPALPPGHTALDLDPYERGNRGINYRTARLAPRLASGDDPAYAFSSALHGDPATGVFRAYPGDRVWLRVLQGADRGRAHTVVVSGHGWHYQVNDANSTIRSAAGMLLPGTGWFFDLVGGAGGPSHAPGDYLVRDGLMLNQVNAGLWFLIRVEGTPQPDLRPLGAPLPKGR
ncbi:multicopper oxidase domain-containing protein [Terrabacter sp. BE26]|uniref:multicopper oxidase domain-containing protein n=1 Tax=Terrabacter sp. BE26 TaxID=2898152 RepID=UPI0035BE4848